MVKLFGDSAFRRGTQGSLCVCAGKSGVASCQQVSSTARRVGPFAYLNGLPSDTANAVARAREEVLRLAAHAYAQAIQREHYRRRSKGT